MLRNRPGLEWPDAPPTLPGMLRQAGYHTYLVGRSMHQYPERQRFGFDHKIDHGEYRPWLESHAPEGSGSYHGTGVMHNDWTARPWHLDESLHFTNWTVNEALRFLRNRDPTCPFFLVVSFIAPHPPFVPPAFYMQRYLRMQLPQPVIGDWAVPPPNQGLGDPVDASRVHLTGERLHSCQAGYFGLINHIDDQMRRILHPLSGLDFATAEHTVVIFTSDHGEMLGDHYLFRKSQPYEGSARIPLLFSAPPRFGIEHRQVIDKPVGLEDVMPTILEMAGLPVPDSVDGSSLLPLMRGEEVGWRRFLHLEHAPHERDRVGGFHSLVSDSEKYIWLAGDGREQLFDLEADPTECRDLTRDPGAAERVAHWRALLSDQLRDRPEGFSDGSRLIAGRRYPSVLGAQ